MAHAAAFSLWKIIGLIYCHFSVTML